MATEVNAVGRIVWGHPGRAQIKKQMEGPQKGQPVLDKDGKPIEVYSFGLAIPKNEFGPVWQAMQAEALLGYPQGNFPPSFAWKYYDGDGIDPDGKPYSLREGHAGCWILVCSQQGFPPQLFWHNGQSYVQMGAEEIKCGDYAQVNIAMKVNVSADRTRKSSLYINPRMVVRIGYGQEIRNGGDPTKAFGAAPAALPQGASATPLAPMGAQPPMGGQMQPGGQMPGQMPMQHNPGMPQQQGYQQQPGPGQYPQQQPQQYNPGNITSGPAQMQPGQQMPGQYAPQPGPGQMPQGQVQPAHDFVQNAGQQQPGQYVQQQPMQQGYQQQPGMMPQGQQMQPGQYQPGGMPGQMPPR